jgi:hypothetical protein
VPGGISRVTVIDTRPLGDPAAAAAWFDELDLAAEATGALAVLNRLLGAQRIAAADPHLHQLTTRAAIAVRGGYGEGRALADGGWTQARELAAPGGGGGRHAAGRTLHSDERLAALLAARERPLACEELALRARLDLDFDRAPAAALGTRMALEAALVELGANARASGLEPRLVELRGLLDDVIAAANSALAGGPASERQQATVRHALERIEALVRARAAARPAR